MQFNLVLIAARPDELILTAETPLAGVSFLEEAGRCLRRNLDGSSKYRHQTLGNLSTYTISVPQQIAIESGWFDSKSTRYLTLSHGFLNDYIFHAANFTYGTANRTYYPYYQNEIVLTSLVDELAVLDCWREKGYPAVLSNETAAPGIGTSIPVVDDASDVSHLAQAGDVVLDDITKGLT